MMKLKKILTEKHSTSEEAHTKALLIADIECKLVLRIKTMAYFFFAFSLASFAFAFFVHPEKEQTSLFSPYREENSFLLDIEAITGATLFSDGEALELSP